jgi:alkylation response protein AidB-like acyl-CoA dehydrogenase
MYNLHLSAEQIEFRDTVRNFVNDEVKPVTLKAERLDRGDRTLPMEVLDKASQMGLRTLALAEDLGGVGADNLTCCIVAEELAAGDADVAAAVMETAMLGRLLFAAMTQTQRDRHLPGFLEDDRFHLARADHEPGAETALGINYHRPAAAAADIKTTAVRDGNGWLLNGVKDCSANAPLAKLFAVEARTEKGVSTFLVTRDAGGLTVGETAGPRWYHGACGTLTLKDCRVGSDGLLGAEGHRALPGRADDGRGAPTMPAINLGIGRAAYEAALEYAQLRVQGGRPIVEHQAIGTKLADIAIRLQVARGAIWQAAWASDHPEAYANRSLADLPLTTVASVFTSEAVYRAAKDAAECFGAMGVMRDMPLQRYIDDARICLYAGDGNADLRLRIAEALANYRRGPSMLAAE